MGYFTPDVYYQPEKFGLKIIGEIGDPWLSWEFDELVVWEHEDGKLYWGSDLGCSCPSPFENYNSVEDLTEITDFEAFAKVVDEYVDDWINGRRDDESDSLRAEKTQLLAKVHTLFNRK